jgi:SnoaL-like domain
VRGGGGGELQQTAALGGDGVLRGHAERAERADLQRGPVRWAADGSYTDPLADVRGADAIASLMGAAQQQFAGLVFTLGGAVDANHNQARFTWHLGPAGGEPVVIGFDVVVLSGDGRIAAVHGFLDQVPAAA